MFSLYLTNLPQKSYIHFGGYDKSISADGIYWMDIIPGAAHW